MQECIFLSRISSVLVLMQRSVPLFTAWSLPVINRDMKWGKQSGVLWVRPGGKRKTCQDFSCQGRFLWMEGVFFPNFPSISFLWMKNNWKIQYRSPKSAGRWLAVAARAPPAVAKVPDYRASDWLVRGKRDFIHKSAHSCGQRQEIRALERGNPPITSLRLARARKASLPKSRPKEKWQRIHFNVNSHKLSPAARLRYFMWR